MIFRHEAEHIQLLPLQATNGDRDRQRDIKGMKAIHVRQTYSVIGGYNASHNLAILRFTFVKKHVQEYFSTRDHCVPSSKQPKLCVNLMLHVQTTNLFLGAFLSLLPRRRGTRATCDCSRIGQTEAWVANVGQTMANAKGQSGTPRRAP